MSNARELAEIGGSYGTGGFVGMKNRIINGAMVIDQRNAGAAITPTAGVYTLDRWEFAPTVASKLTIQQNAGSLSAANRPAGFINYLGTTSTSAYSVTNSDFFTIRQNIEGLNAADLGWGTANASTVTLSFWVRSSLTGTHSGSVYNVDGTRSYIYSFTVNSANTWEYKTITIAGDTTGTWLTTNGVGIRVGFNLGTGSTYLTTAGSWNATLYLAATGSVNVVGTNGATFYITGVQLEKGSTATSFDYRPYGTELALCQRYFEVLTMTPFGNALASGYYSAAVYTATYSYRVTKRAAPTASLGATASWSGTTPSIASPSVDTIYFASVNSTPFFLAATAGQTGITFSSEL
jgi:hypothetical protein